MLKKFIKYLKISNFIRQQTSVTVFFVLGFACSKNHFLSITSLRNALFVTFKIKCQGPGKTFFWRKNFWTGGANPLHLILM